MVKNRYISLLFAGMTFLASGLLSCNDTTEKTVQTNQFVRIEGQDLIQPDGSKLFIKGTNLGNWLNPEGYMFGSNKTNSG